MNKVEFIKKYKDFCVEFGLKENEAIISAGGVLLMVGLRIDTEDLDLDVPNELYDRLCKEKVGELVKTVMGEYILFGDYSIHRGVNESISTTMFDGVCCYSLEEVLKQKENIRRPLSAVEKIEQDKRDIEALKKMIAQ